ncbi:hypothetical protein HKD37_02G004499 [Glycine soja]
MTIEIEEDADIPLILGCPFMSTASCVVDIGKKMQLGIEDQKISFDLFHEDKETLDRNVCFKVHVMEERRLEKKLSAHCCAKPNIFTMASRKRKAPSTPTQAKFDRSRFTSQEAWGDTLTLWCLVSFYQKGICNIGVSIVKEFYANLYDPEDKSPKFTLLRPDPQELAAKLCIPGRRFELNADGQPLKILRKNKTTLAQTWSVLSFSNLILTSHTSDVTLDRAKLIYGIIMKMDMNVGYLISHQISLIAQHDTSRQGFPAVITALCTARGVQSDSRSLESQSPAINLAYIKKNYWNLNDPTVTFRGPRMAKGKRSEAPSTSAPETPAPSSSTAPVPLSSSTQIPIIPPVPLQMPLSIPFSARPSDFTFTPQMLQSMLQSIHRGQSTIMQSLQGLGLPFIMSMGEFEAQVAWPRD